MANIQMPPKEPVAPPRDFASQPLERQADQIKDTLDNLVTSTKKATDLLKDASSSSLQAACEYNSKLMEFAVANNQANMDWARKLTEFRSPADFIGAMGEHARVQFDTFARQAKELSALAAHVVPKVGDMH